MKTAILKCTETEKFDDSNATSITFCWKEIGEHEQEHSDVRTSNIFFNGSDGRTVSAKLRELASLIDVMTQD